jgi:outer membrane protein assembly factor BamB
MAQRGKRHGAAVNFRIVLKIFACAAVSVLAAACSSGWMQPGGAVFDERAAGDSGTRFSLAPPLREAWVTRLTTVPQRTFSATDGLLLTGSMDGRAAFIRIGDGRVLKSVKMEDRTETVCGLCDSLWIACLLQGRRTVFAFRLRDGKRVWTADAGPVTAGPLHAGTALFLGAAEKEALALNAAMGRVLWKKSLGGSVCGVAAASADSILFAVESGRLFCLNAGDGSVLWRAELPGDLDAGPAVWNGTAYLGTVNGWFCAVRCRDGAVVWRFKSRGGVHLQAACDTGAVYFGTSGGVLHALNLPEGTERWRFSMQGPVSTRPLPSGACVYAGSADRRLYAIDAKTGTEAWKTELKGRVRCDPFIHQGMLFTGSEENLIYAFTPARGPQ